MNNNRLKLIAFDLGYTLAYNRREDHYMNFLESESVIIPREKVEKAYHLADKTFMRSYHGVLGNPPEYYMPWYIGLVNYFLNVKFDLIHQVTFIMAQGKPGSSYWQPFPWTTQVMDTLKNNGYRLALLSNWDLTCRRVLKQIGVYDYFEQIIVSSEINISKPDVGIFKYLLDITHCAHDEVLYVGDNYYDDVVGAGKLGIQTVLINRFGREGIEEIEVPYLVQNTTGLLKILGLEK
ncbi:HAD family hydrolase [Neobacillus dielmonensis]|uniref:HAD family hydrolase n=1 Tax=Neobacillus dielmonensis TaxID=1347369 RepID=UPI0005A6CA4A|nr:HAD family hydrolase [Neobacillus dielmonensis]